MSAELDRQIAALKFELERHASFDHLSDAASLGRALVTLEWMAKHEGIIRSAVRLASEELKPFKGLDIDESAVMIKRART